MPTISLLCDADLLDRLPVLVRAEGVATADVVEHLVEVERRRLYLEQACSSLFTYRRDRLEYAPDSALKRARAAKLALRFPRALEELQSGAIHLTGLFLLSSHLTEDNADALLTEARGKSKSELEQVIARWFPRPDVAPRVQALGAALDGEGVGRSGPGTASGPSARGICSGAGAAPFRLEPLSPERYRIEFTASSEFRAKLERARELASHSVPSGDPALILGARAGRADRARAEATHRSRQAAPALETQAGLAPCPGRGRAAGLGAGWRSVRCCRRRAPALYGAPISHDRASTPSCPRWTAYARESLSPLQRPQRLRGAPGVR
jgi:hypothetical protein